MMGKGQEVPSQTRDRITVHSVCSHSPSQSLVLRPGLYFHFENLFVQPAVE